MAIIHVMHCREIATLLDSDAVEHLSWVDRVQLRCHLWVCWHCRLLVRQIRWLGEAARNEMSAGYSEETDLEQRILNRMLQR
jgi:hypothetical protein